MKSNILLLFTFLLGIYFAKAQTSTIPPGYNLVYSQDFSSPQSILEFDMTDNRAWKISSEDENQTLELHGKSEYAARVRSPFNIALLKNLMLGDFVMEVRLAQSGKEYGHRDLCLFFGMENPSNFYYVHIATAVDDHANNIFIVNDEPRIKISSKTSSGTDWGPTNSWHKARIERTIEDGAIRIYFDDMTAPIMEATDTHFDIGRIGFGSFDDTGRFDDIKIWAPAVHSSNPSYFQNGN